MSTTKQFTVNTTYSLRAISITNRANGLKASEPSQTPFEQGAKFVAPDGDLQAPSCTFVAVEAAGGGEWWGQILTLEGGGTGYDRVRVSTNKVAGTQAATAYLDRPKGKAAPANGHAKDPLSRFNAALSKKEAAEKALQLANDELIAAAKALQALKASLATAEALLEPAKTDDELLAELEAEEARLG